MPHSVEAFIAPGDHPEDEVGKDPVKLRLLEALAEEGRISLRYVGDELVLALVEAGAPASRTAPSDEAPL